MKMTRLCVLFGGRSPEHDVSCMSVVSVIGAIDRSKYELTTIGITKDGRWLIYDGPVEKISDGSWQEYAEKKLAEEPEKYGFSVLAANGRGLKDMTDFVLPIVHGPYCEDGKLQGLLEMADVPYGGCGVTASAVAMDKIIAKQVFESAGLPVTKYTYVTTADIADDLDACLDQIEKAVGYPAFIKPANMGSSVGISKASDRDELKAALDLASRHDRRILCEEAVDCREIETGVLGNDDVKVTVPGEIVATEDFYDYDSKYVDDGKPKMQIPADIPEELSEKIRDIAARAYRAIDGSGFARCDFFVDRKTGSIYINEINTLPGFTAFSMFPLLWEAAGSPYSSTIERIIELGYERYNDKTDRTSDK